MPGIELIVEEQKDVVITGRGPADEGITEDGVTVTEEAITEEGREPVTVEAKAVAEAVAEAEVVTEASIAAEAAVEGSAPVEEIVGEVGVVTTEAAPEV